MLLSASPQHDVVLRGGHVIDPKNNIDARMDVAVRDGRISAVGPSLDGKKVLDVTGLYITPGAVDIHTHLFTTPGVPGAWAGDQSIRPDDFSFRNGTTTMVDAGSAGWRNFADFRVSVIDRAATRVFALINIAGYGMTSNFVEQDPREFSPSEVAKLAAKHKDVVVGVKTAHYEHPDWKSVDAAVEAGKLAGIPVMVDFGYFPAERPYWQLVTRHLRAGDISTHCYRASVPWVDAAGKLHPFLYQARERGVRFDVGHGGGSFVFRNAVPAVAAGFWPDVISTDLHAQSMNGAMMDLPTTMSKFLAMGLPLKEAVLRATWLPAQVIRRPELGHLDVGAVADIAAWRLLDGDFGYADVEGGLLRGKQRLMCELTIRAGRIVWDWNARAASDYRKLPPDYGLRQGIDVIVVPKR
jgi:dihydroorotase